MTVTPAKANAARRRSTRSSDGGCPCAQAMGDAEVGRWLDCMVLVELDRALGILAEHAVDDTDVEMEDSGGPMLNLQGQVIGVVSAKRVGLKHRRRRVRYLRQHGQIVPGPPAGWRDYRQVSASRELGPLALDKPGDAPRRPLQLRGQRSRWYDIRLGTSNR